MTTTATTRREVTWNDFNWPDWVPEKNREEIIGFWGPRNQRTMFHWVESAQQNQSPLFGTNIPVLHVQPGVDLAYEDKHFEFIIGYRYLFAWNNMARIFHADGQVEIVSIHPHSPKIDWSAVHPAKLEDLRQYVPGILLEMNTLGVIKGYLQ